MNYDKVYLRKRPKFDEMIDEIEIKQPKIKYPNRNAQLLRNSPYLSQFDGDQSFINMEEQENNIAKEQILAQLLRRLSSQNGMTHASLQARSSSSISERSSYPPPSNYESADSDFTGYADSEINRRELEKRARYMVMAERARQDLDSHVKQTARGIFDSDSDSDPFKSEASYVGRSVKERQVKEILDDVIDNIFKRPTTEEQASSSTSQPVYPSGLNTVALPKTRARARSSKSPGTKREGNEPESVPRRIRTKSLPPTLKDDPKPEPKPKGRPKGSTNKPNQRHRKI